LENKNAKIVTGTSRINIFPLLFNILTEGLLEELDQIKTLEMMYADDLLLISNNWNDLDKATDIFLIGPNTVI
jgi:hypothetical protein